MDEVTLGFIGGGRVTALLLRGLARGGVLPARVTVADPDAVALGRIEAIAPNAIRCTSDDREAGAADIVFLAVHPPVVEQVLGQLFDRHAERSIVVSLVPTIPMAKLAASLGGSTRLARMIPNAPSAVGKGYNPVAFHSSLPSGDRRRLLEIFGHWGAAPEVAEESLEAYAVLTAMGPTYFWFQWLEMQRLAGTFGVADAEAREALAAMLHGAVSVLFESGLPPADVIDMVPVRPLKSEEETIRQILDGKLSGVYRKLTGPSS